MAELVDALDSKSGYRKVVQVRFLFGAQEWKGWNYFLPFHFYFTLNSCLTWSLA
jgi:hypothetical protein